MGAECMLCRQNDRDRSDSSAHYGKVELLTSEAGKVNEPCRALDIALQRDLETDGQRVATRSRACG